MGRWRRELVPCPRTLIRDARDGERIKIVGCLRASRLLFAPMTGTRCIWYAAGAQLWASQDTWSEYIAVRTRTRVFIEDESGSASIDMKNAEVSLADGGRRWWRTPVGTPEGRRAKTFLESRGAKLRLYGEWLGAKYREAVLKDGDRVVVFGSVTHEPDPTVRAGGGRELGMRGVLGYGASGLVISDAPDVWA